MLKRRSVVQGTAPAGAQLPFRARVRERGAAAEVDRVGRASARVAAGRADDDDAEGLPGRALRRGLTGGQLRERGADGAAVFFTSAAARATPRVCSRVSGDEMPTDATISPCGSRIGAATQRTSSMYSPSSSANPSTRTCAHDARETRHRPTRRARVDLQRRAARADPAGALRSQSASSALPCAVQCSGANSPVCPATDTTWPAGMW